MTKLLQHSLPLINFAPVGAVYDRALLPLRYEKRAVIDHAYSKISAVQRFSACLGMVAMLVALVTAPLFHVHDDDDHGHQASLVHAHFLDSHEAESHPEHEIEPLDDRHQARWIDYFTLQIPAEAFALAVDFSEEIAAPILEQSQGVILVSEPRAHSPPGLRFSIPRSPPAI